MSHQTGIKASETLKSFLAESKDGHIRLIKIGIEGEELQLIDHVNVSGTWEDDFDDSIQPRVEAKQPCYIFYRLDNQNNQGFVWLFIAYSPDDSEVRQKMLYAGTRSTMKQEFGGGLISDELFATSKSEVTLSGYKKHMQSQTADAPLTMAEVELKEVKQQHLNAATSTKAETLPGVTFPMTDDAINALIKIGNKECSYAQLSIDVEQEIINLVKVTDIEVDELCDQVPTDQPRYHFFIFKHSHEGDYLQSIIFIYSMPGYACSVKERMLYSSCKATLVSGCEDILKMDISKKLEISEGSELTPEFLTEELHPQKNIHRQKFAKPKGPGGRGAKRLIKKEEQNNE